MELPNGTMYRVETELIPACVDLTLAGQRSTLIERYRRGELDAEATLRAALRLYYQNQGHPSDETRHYLIDVATDFPMEADMDDDLVDRIWQEEQVNGTT